MWERFVSGALVVGVFWGCSVPYGEPPPPQGTTTATDVTSPRRGDDSGAPIEAGAGPGLIADASPLEGPHGGKGAEGGIEAGVDAGRACPAARTIDATKLPWKPPAAMVGSCTQGDLDAFVSYVSTTKATSLAQWKVDGVANVTCRACMFGSEANVAWAPIVELPGGEDGFVNVGGCIGLASGNTVCGKAYQNWSDCRFTACADCNKDEAAACLVAANVAGGACEKATTDVIAICGGALSNAEARCRATTYNFEGPVKAQCIGGV